MSTITDPGRRLKIISGVSVLGTFVAWVLFALLTSPVLYHGINMGPSFAGFVALGIFGWGIWFGQQLYSTGFIQDYKDMQEYFGENNLVLRPIFTLLSIGYYNLVLLVTLYGAILIAAHGFASIAALFALIYPVYDIAIIRRGYPLSIAGILAILIAVGVVVANIGHLSWREIDFGNVVYRFIGPRSYELS